MFSRRNQLFKTVFTRLTIKPERRILQPFVQDKPATFPIKNTSWSGMLNAAKDYEGVGEYDKSEKLFSDIIKEAKKIQTPLSQGRKGILIEAYVLLADSIRIRSLKEEDQAIGYLNEVLKLDPTNLAAFKAKRNILADRGENISDENILSTTNRPSR
jgi:tetratricopeptide (TPR) repeat protein